MVAADRVKPLLRQIFQRAGQIRAPVNKIADAEEPVPRRIEPDLPQLFVKGGEAPVNIPDDDVAAAQVACEVLDRVQTGLARLKEASVIVFVAMMPVAAIGPVLMVVIVVVTMMVVAVVVTMMAVTVTVVVVVVAMVGALLWLKAALHGDDSAALAARQFGECRAVLDIKRVAGKFSEAVLAAEMPGETHQAKRILGAYLQQLFGRRLDLNKRSILQPKGVTVIDGGLHVEIEMDFGPGLPGEVGMAAVARCMVEGDRVDHALRLHGRLADDGGGAGHGVSREKWTLKANMGTPRRVP